MCSPLANCSRDVPPNDEATSHAVIACTACRAFAGWSTYREQLYGVTPTITQTSHGDITAITAVHDQNFTHRLGGVRFVQRGSVDEVIHLAAGMAEKCAASRVPVSGQKTLVICPSGVPQSAELRAAILEEHLLSVLSQDDGGIFGPDMACGNDVLDLLATRPVVGAHVTGLSESRYGLGINARAFTARGCVHALDSHVRLRASTYPRTAVVQGFGAVGAPVARSLANRGIIVRAVSNTHGALVCERGLDLERLFALWLEQGDNCFGAYLNLRGAHTSFEKSPEALFEVDAELFVPAARTTVLARVIGLLITFIGVCHELVGLAIALLPALQTFRGDLQRALQQNTRTAAGGRLLLRRLQ